MYYINSITNRKTGYKVCEYYYNKPIDLTNSTIKRGEQLQIKYIDGIYFTHETVEDVFYDNEMYKIITTKKIWYIKEI